MNGYRIQINIEIISIIFRPGVDGIVEAVIPGRNIGKGPGPCVGSHIPGV
ncbi:hypothetical protein ES705_03665 [subsurface metagenome]